MYSYTISDPFMECAMECAMNIIYRLFHLPPQKKFDYYIQCLHLIVTRLQTFNFGSISNAIYFLILKKILIVKMKQIYEKKIPMYNF